MASMRSIKGRIRSIGSTQQITRAMNLVAASKLQRAKIKLLSARPFYEETRKVINSIVSSARNVNNNYLKIRAVKNSAIVILSGDRGLCGGYNVNISKAAAQILQTKEIGSERIISVGSKARDYFRKRRCKIIRTYSGLSETPFYEDANEIGSFTIDLFNSGDVDEVYLVYTAFKSLLNQEPTTIKILPLERETFSQNSSQANFEFEPDAETFLNSIIPKYISTLIYGAMIESAACELSSRMTSMDSATKNSIELIDKFTLLYNRARQSAITQEITEIVSGANALD